MCILYMVCNMSPLSPHVLQCREKSTHCTVYLAREATAVHDGDESIVGGREMTEEGHTQGETLVNSFGSLHQQNKHTHAH